MESTARRTRVHLFAVLNAMATGKRRMVFDAQSAKERAISAKLTAPTGRNRHTCARGAPSAFR